MINALNINRLALAAMLATLCALSAGSAANAQGFLDHRSNGMQKCVRAILFGVKTAKGVNVHGHHFHCKPIVRGIAGRRVVRLSHDQFGKDDQITYSFRVDRRGRYIRDTLNVKVSKGVRIGSFWIDWGGPSNFSGMTYHDIASRVTGIKPVKVKRWQTASNQIAFVVLAQLGFIGER